MEESCLERQENELQALQAIYMDDFQDLREKVSFDRWISVHCTCTGSVTLQALTTFVEIISPLSAIRSYLEYCFNMCTISLINAREI